MTKKLIYEQEASCLLYDLGKGGLLIEVSVGTIAQYVVEMKLNEEEVKEFGVRGNPFIDELARKVSFAEPRYRKAGRTKVF